MSMFQRATLTREELFLAWAPPSSVWSPWVKPVLFAQLPESVTLTSPPALPVRWLPALSADQALIVDVSGEDAVVMGLALARVGYRPVPLFNANNSDRAVLSQDRIIAALISGTALLQRLTLPPDAPPAFLLDADRLSPMIHPAPGLFDNRWTVFPQDFPSATRLRAQGITQVTILHSVTRPGFLAPPIERDLLLVLRQWHAGGLGLFTKDPRNLTAPSQPLAVTTNWRDWAPFAEFASRALAFSLRRNSAGGFGAPIPIPSDGGGFG